MKKNKSSKSWIIKQHRDQFYKKSKVLGYRARSAFKLIELNNKFKFLKKNTNLLDVGCSPGGWMQVAKETLKAGKIMGIDIKSMDKIEGTIFIKADFLEANTKNEILKLFNNKLDVIISDMAADTTGNKDLDCIRTNTLCSEVINFSLKMLKEDGILISKAFMGEDFLEIKELANKHFKKVNFFKPESSRNESREIYLHCALLNTL